MFARIRTMLHAGAEWAEAEFRLARRRMKRSAVRLGALVALGAIGVVAACALLAGVVLVIAPKIGAAPALLLVSGLTLLPTLGAVWFMLNPRRTFGEYERAQAAAVEARRRLRDAAPFADSDIHDKPHTFESDEPRERSRTPKPPTEDLLETLADPRVLGSVAFALVSVLGVGRTLRLVRAGATAFAAAASVARAVHAAQGERSKPHSNGQPRPSDTNGRFHEQERAQATTPR